MDRQYDIIVIGAGNGGLSAAASACSRGFRTLLIEQHNLPGGFATSFRRGRFEFEPALHELCDVGEPDAREEVGALIDSYGAKVDWVRLPEAYRLIICGEGEEKIDAVMPFGKEAYIDKMEEYVPGSRESMEKFFYLADCIMAANAAVAAAGGKADPKVMMKEHPDFLKCANYPTAVVLRKLKMPLKAQKILSAYWCYMGVNMEDLEFGFYAALVHKYIVNAAYIPRYRSHELSVAMDRTIRERGGTILYNTLATKILMEEGAPVGVETTHGTFYARHIIPDISPNAVFGDMMDGGKDLPEAHIRAVNARKIGGRGYCVYVGLNRTAEELGVREYSYFISELSDTVKEQELAGTFREHPMQATIWRAPDAGHDLSQPRDPRLLAPGHLHHELHHLLHEGHLVRRDRKRVCGEEARGRREADPRFREGHRHEHPALYRGDRDRLARDAGPLRAGAAGRDVRLFLRRGRRADGPPADARRGSAREEHPLRQRLRPAPLRIQLDLYGRRHGREADDEGHEGGE